MSHVGCGGRQPQPGVSASVLSDEGNAADRTRGLPSAEERSASATYGTTRSAVTIKGLADGGPARPSAVPGRASIDAQRALIDGRKLRGNAGLELLDVGQGFMAAMAAVNGGTSGTSTGFSVRVYTPQTWATQLVSDATKVRVFVYPDKPTYVTAAGMAGTSSVRHVVLRDQDRRVGDQAERPPQQGGRSA